MPCLSALGYQAKAEYTSLAGGKKTLFSDTGKTDAIKCYKNIFVGIP
jgi:hypothetical protein